MHHNVWWIIESRIRVGCRSDASWSFDDNSKNCIRISSTLNTVSYFSNHPDLWTPIEPFDYGLVSLENRINSAVFSSLFLSPWTLYFGLPHVFPCYPTIFLYLKTDFWNPIFLKFFLDTTHIHMIFHLFVFLFSSLQVMGIFACKWKSFHISKICFQVLHLRILTVGFMFTG